MRIILAMVLLLQAGIVFPAETDLTLSVPDGTLGGTLLTPPEPGPWPVVLILAGSGAVDRDGNLAGGAGRNNSLKQLAEGLAGHGVASLRVDKRGVGGSESAGRGEEGHRFEHLVDDAVAWCGLLAADARFSSLTLVGHSQGSLVGMVAAWQADADGFVSLAGAGRPILELLAEQLTALLPGTMLTRAEAVMAELAAGRTVADPPQELTVLFRPSIQGFLISWQRYDPVSRLRRLACPVAIVQGLMDTKVKEADARALHAARPDAELLLLAELGHLFKPMEADTPLAAQLAMFRADPPFDPWVIETVARVARKADGYHAAREAALDRLQSLNRFDEKAVPGTAVAGCAEALQASAAGYLFGLAAGGYAGEGLIIPAGGHHDCVSFMYRATELSRAASVRESLSWALRTRFAGAHPDSVVDAQGRCDYDRPEHLDYSLDMIRTGIWGRDITAELSGARADERGTSRYAAGSFAWVPERALETAELRPGDIVWFVLDPTDEKARRLREEYGLAIGHIGILGRDGRLRHAASKPLPGLYERPGVQTVDLGVYLERVERYGGVMVTRPSWATD